MTNFVVACLRETTTILQKAQKSVRDLKEHYCRKEVRGGVLTRRNFFRNSHSFYRIVQKLKRPERSLPPTGRRSVVSLRYVRTKVCRVTPPIDWRYYLLNFLPLKKSRTSKWKGSDYSQNTLKQKFFEKVDELHYITCWKILKNEPLKSIGVYLMKLFIGFTQSLLELSQATLC